MPSKSTHHNALSLLLTSLILLMAAAALIFNIDTMHMRPDEHLTFANMQGTFGEAMTRLATKNNQAPLWWINSWFWQHGIGMEEFTGRYNSVLITLLTLAVVYQLGKMWFGTVRAGQFAILLLAVNSLFLTYALEMRMYALGMLVTVLSMRAFWGWVRRRSTSRAVIYGLSTALLLYIHYYLVFVVLAQVVYFVLFETRSWQRLLQGVLAGVIGLLAWLPGALILVGQLQFIDFGASGGLNNPTQPTNLDTLSDLFLISTSGQFALYSVLLILSVMLLWQRRAYWLVLMWLFLAPGTVLLLNTQFTLYNIRYVAFIAPAIGIIIGAALAALPRRWQWPAVALTCAISLATLSAQLPQRTPFRHILEEVSSNATAEDMIFAYEHGEEGYLADQLRRYLPPDLLENRVETTDLAQSEQRVWFLTTTWFSEEVRSAFSTLETTHRLRYVAGDCTSQWCYLAQLLVAAPLREPLVFGDELGFYGAEITQTDETLTALLWWSVDAAPSQDYSISLQLLDEAGTLVEQVDRQIQETGESPQIPTSQMIPEGTYLDQRTLTLTDLAAGEYEVRLVVYRWQDGTRLIVNNRDHLVIDTLTLP